MQFFHAKYAMAAADLRCSLGLASDPYAMIFCFLAEARMGLDVIGQLKDDARELDLDKWPGALIGLFLGSLTPGAAFKAASGHQEQAESQFYIGQWYLLTNAQTEAVAALREAVRLCPTPFLEHAGAVAELDRLGCK
jgi:lipoprotein NlpI